MTRAFVLLLALACCGCAAVRGGGEVQPAGQQSWQRVSAVGAAAPAPTLFWTAPAYLALGCEPDTTRPARDVQTHYVLKLNTVTPPMYFPGCEAWLTCWQSVVAFNVPDTVATLRNVWPGAACSTSVGPGQYVVLAKNWAGATPCWSRIVLVP